jgi:hypothetical protein
VSGCNQNRSWRNYLWRKPGIQTLIVLLSFFLLLGQQLVGFANDPGVGWHLADGAQIAATSEIPRTDTFLSEPRAWISDQWLSDLFLYHAYQYGGWPFLYSVVFVVYMLTFFGIVYPATRAICKGALSASLATFVAFKLGQIHFILRPVVFSFTLFAVLVMAVFGPIREHIRRDSRFGALTWIGIPVLFLLWAQIHPSFVMGLLLLGLVLVGGFLDRAIFARPISARSLALLALLLLLSVASTLVNPYTYRLHESIVALGQSDYFMHLNSEWLPIRWLSYEACLFFLCILGAGVGCLVGRRHLGWGSFEYLALAVFVALGARSARMLPLCAIVSVVPIAELVRWLGTTSWARDGFVVRLMWPFLDRLGRREARASFGGGLLVLLLCVVVVDSVRTGRLLTFDGPFGPTRDAYPYGGVHEIMVRSQHEDGKPVVITIPNWGGFVVWESQGRLLPQIDDRNTMIGEDDYRAIIDALKNPKELLEYAQAKRGRYILVPRGTVSTPDPAVEVLYEDSFSEALRVR